MTAIKCEWTDTLRWNCREWCACYGEPPCWQADDTAKPCEDCVAGRKNPDGKRHNQRNKKGPDQMGKLTIPIIDSDGNVDTKRWQCDRCKQVFDERPHPDRGEAIYTLVATKDYGVGGLALPIYWKEMCPLCNAKVGAEIRDLVERIC